MRSLVTTIPFNDIGYAKIYVNEYRKTMSQLKYELGCTEIINGGFFDTTMFHAVNMLVADGVIYSSSKGKLGISIMDEQVCLSYQNNVNFPNHVSAYPCLIKDEKKAWNIDPIGTTGQRGRSAMGITKDGIVLRTVEDVLGNSDMTLWNLYGDMKERGCIHAINLDGGGSTQCDFMGEKLISNRIVHNFICFWRKGVVKDKIVNVKSVLNIRRDPPNAFGINASKVVGSYANGECVKVLNSIRGWCLTPRGWIYGAYLK